MSAVINRLTRRAAMPNGRESGVTLVELMIAMMLGLVLTAGMIRVFTGNRETYAFNDGLSRVQENARFALDRITQSARMAGYRGCLADVAVTNNLAAPNPLRDDLAVAMRGHDFNGTGDGQLYAAAATDPAPLANAGAWTPALPAELANPALVVPGSDVLVVRYASGDAAPLVAPFSDALQLTVAAPTNFQTGQLLVVTDCQRASIFQLTGIVAAGGNLNLSHGAGGFVPGNGAAAWGPNQTYGLASEVARLEAVAYYVGRGESNAPSLFQLRSQRTGATTSQFVAEELVEGIDTMQVRYGIDTDNDRQVNVWQTADVVEAANNWASVLSVEITLLARSTEEYGTETDAVIYNVGGMRFDPINDRRLRKVFTTTIALRNRLP
jgi:type IV pilus assembly protein PilW